jgi:hypothetical protein
VIDRKIKTVTLKDIAEKLGLSAMTVSRHVGKESLVALIQRGAGGGQGDGLPNLALRGACGEDLSTIVMFAEEISSHHYLASWWTSFSIGASSHQLPVDGELSWRSISVWRGGRDRAGGLFTTIRMARRNSGSIGRRRRS